jgi:hypothetical protein
MIRRALPEQWRSIPGFPGYEASSYGRIRSPYHSAPLAPVIPQNNGYLFTNIIDVNGRKQHVGIHVLVCTAFHGPRPSTKHEVAHWDSDRMNNRASNVRWATRRQNNLDKQRHGKQAYGTEIRQSKLSEADVLEIRALLQAGQLSFAKIAGSYNICVATVHAIKHRKTWQWL